MHKRNSMNNTIISEEKLTKLKLLAKKIESIETELICFGNDSNLEYKQRKLTERLTKIIKFLLPIENKRFKTFSESNLF